MCGLTGWFGRPGNEDDDQALAHAMVAAIVHRGPDGNGIHVDEGDGRRPAEKVTGSAPYTGSTVTE